MIPITLRRVSRSLLLVAGLVTAFWMPNTAWGFAVGGNYDLTFNAFVSGPGNTPALEGHFASDLVFDGRHDDLPMNFPTPADLDGKDLTVLELMENMGEARGAMPAVDFYIQAVDGGPLVVNEFLPGSFGRVTVSLANLLWADGWQGPGSLKPPMLQAIDAFGTTRNLDADVHVSGDGQMHSPWRILATMPGSEFGAETETLRLFVETVPEPIGSASLAIACLWVWTHRRRVLRK